MWSTNSLIAVLKQSTPKPFSPRRPRRRRRLSVVARRLLGRLHHATHRYRNTEPELIIIRFESIFSVLYCLLISRNNTLIVLFEYV